MLFNSIEYLVFLPIVVLAYYIIPSRCRYIWLLIVSYYFYMCWEPRYALLIAFSTVATYLGGMGLEFVKNNEESHSLYSKLIVIGMAIINLGILFFFKYFDWILANINNLFHKSIEMPFSIVLPIGISFYTFQTLSYIFDIYRGTSKAEKNLFRYALFVSFFPQLVAGPIERTGDLLPQINTLEKIRWNNNNVRNGLLLILYGMFLKLVIADRAAILVNNVFDNYFLYGFVELTIAAVLFAIQILCDFNGYTIVARGSALLLGITLSDNFKQPYFAETIRDFWQRWHISLTSWFTDYLYIPLGGNRKGKLRRYINSMIVFSVSGLWHGAGWHYMIWGFLHGIYLNVNHICRTQMNKWRRQETNHFSSHILRIGITFILTDIAWVFFRAASCKDAVLYFRQMLICFQKYSLLELGLEWYEWIILICAVIIMLIVDFLHEKGIKIRERILEERIWFRWLIYLLLLWVVVLFGIYGAEYDASQFIYFQF